MFVIGPVSVAPDWQKGKKGKSIGSALIEAGLSRLKAIGANGCVLVGNPDYYGRFGFRSGGITYGDVPSARRGCGKSKRDVQWLRLPHPEPDEGGGDVPTGEVRYARGFKSYHTRRSSQPPIKLRVNSGWDPDVLLAPHSRPGPNCNHP